MDFSIKKTYLKTQGTSSIDDFCINGLFHVLEVHSGIVKQDTFGTNSEPNFVLTAHLWHWQVLSGPWEAQM